MRRFVTVAILLVAGYYAWTVGLPWAREQLGARSRGSAEGQGESTCVQMAVDASGTTVDLLLLNARPPVDPTNWSTALIQVGGRIGAAESICACPSAACAKAIEALGEMRAMVEDFDGMVRQGAAGIGNPATRQERINRLLDEARALAGP